MTAQIPIIHCKSTRELPTWLYPVVEGAGLTLEKVAEQVREKYGADVTIQAFECGGLVYIKHPEAVE